jgi:hypothetical protein
MIKSDILDRAEEAEELARCLLDFAAKLRRSPSSQAQTKLFWPAGQTAMSQSVADVMTLRRQRSKHINASLFGEPAWDMLLALFSNHLAQTDLTIEQVCQTGGPFETTTRRWFDILVTRGLVEVAGNGIDERQNLARLTERGMIAMSRSFVDMQEASVSEPWQSAEDGITCIQLTNEE